MAATAQQPQLALTRRRFTVEEFYRLAEVGVLHEDDRIELIDGELIEMAAIGLAHAHAIVALDELANSMVVESARVSVQNPIHLGPRTQPQPDLALIHRRLYAVTHPTPKDIFLVIEVADSSLNYDREVKVPLYAEAGISEMWIVNLNGRTIERYNSPRDGRYTQIAIAAPGDTLTSLSLPAFIVPVAQVFFAEDASADV